MPTASGRIVKPNRAKKSTLRQKNHTWQSFSEKIKQLHSLDPLKKIRRHDLDQEDLSITTSYFRQGVERWTSLNIATGFSAFRREVLPLCDSLPQIFHHRDQIMDLLEQHILKHDKESLEPLLDLLTAFAHDLGVRFEQFYKRSLELIVGIASKMHEVEVIEWTFTCLAFLFKYLSKLVVPNLVPTYEIIAPLAGKAKQPPYIARFAAEALSFLIKKAASPSHRTTALPLIIAHVKQDLETMRDHPQYELYYHGIMTMFAEALKETGEHLHSNAADLLRAMLKDVPTFEFLPDAPTPWVNVVCGVLTSAIHHSNAATFAQLEDAVSEFISSTIDADLLADSNAWKLSAYIRLLGVMAGVRHGTRISNWSRLADLLCRMLSSISQSRIEALELKMPSVWDHTISNLAIVWHRAPVDALVPNVTRFLQLMTTRPLGRWFVPFCAYFAEINPARFRSLFQKEFYRFVASHWMDDQNEALLYVFMPNMVDLGAIPSKDSKEAFHLPLAWQEKIEAYFERLRQSSLSESSATDGQDDCLTIASASHDSRDEEDSPGKRAVNLPKYTAALRLLTCSVINSSTETKIAEILLEQLKRTLESSSSPHPEMDVFYVTHGFEAYLELTTSKNVDKHLQPLLIAAAPRFIQLPQFLNAVLGYANKISSQISSTSGSKIDVVDAEPLTKHLIPNLASCSHNLRLSSLKLLQLLQSRTDVERSLETMFEAESTPFDLQNSRRITSLLLQRVCENFAKTPADSWLAQAIPSFLFGMLSVRIAPIWQAAVEFLKTIGQDKNGGEMIIDLCMEWLSVPSHRNSGPVAPITGNGRGPRTDFECTSLMGLQETAGKIKHRVANINSILAEWFSEAQHVDNAFPPNARWLALQVLAALPNLAEKRSRKLVPHLICWASEDLPNDHRDSVGDLGEEEDLDTTEAEDDDTGKGDNEGLSWSLPDRKALIGVFAKFGNPRAIYQSAEVYDAMVKLIANGDVELQKLALQAILTWKQPEIKEYKEHLEYLLDEARFRDELAVFFQGDHKVLPEHRAVLMPVLLRLLYGRTISKKGVSTSLRGVRRAVIRCLSVEDMHSYVDIVLGKLQGIMMVDETGIREEAFNDELLPPRRRVGFLNMAQDLINELGSGVLPYTTKLLHAVLYCLFSACRTITKPADDKDEHNIPDSNAHFYAIRKTGVKCLVLLFQNAQTFNWDPFMTSIVDEVISPRVDLLPVENMQSVSGLFQLFYTWASLPKTALGLGIDKRLLPKVIEVISLSKAKEEVKIFVLGIIKRLVNMATAPATESQFNELIREELLDPNISSILNGVNGVLAKHQSVGRNLVETCIEFMVECAAVIRQDDNIQTLLDICTNILVQSPGVVNPKIKSITLKVVDNFISIARLNENQELMEKVYRVICSLFSYFKDSPTRFVLTQILTKYSELDANLVQVAELSTALNAFSTKQIDTPDYTRRLEAFVELYRPRSPAFSSRQWLPLMHNLLYFMKTDDEGGALAMNSADGLCRMILDAAAAIDEAEVAEFTTMFTGTLLPDAAIGIRERAEIVQRSYLRVIHCLTKSMKDLPEVADLRQLLPQEDLDEPETPGILGICIFNIHGQSNQHQLDVLKRVAAVNKESELSSHNVGKILIPLLEHFVYDHPEGHDDKGIGAAVTETISALGSALEWRQYRGILRRYIDILEARPEIPKRTTRMVGKFSDALTAAAAQKNSETTDGEGNVTERCRLAKTMPAQSKLTEGALLLAPLFSHVNKQDESTVSARVPIGITIVKLLQLLPQTIRDQKLCAVLVDICHILRSKAWEAREMARSTLAQISTILGPAGFGYILKELRAALTKGYQLHVLSYTLHSLLIAVTPHFSHGDLDYCHHSMMSIIMDDIFGVTGEEKEAEEYKAKFIEIKSSKSQDTMELLARSTSIPRLIDLVKPLRSLLQEKLNLRMARKIDELLTRITAGLIRNPGAGTEETLAFCRDVIQDVYNSQKPEREVKLDPKIRRYLLQRGARKTDKGLTTRFTYKLIRFALDVLKVTFKQHNSLRTSEHIESLIPIIGDSVVGGEEEVRIAAFKLLTVLAKVPVNNDATAGLFKVALKEASKSIAMSHSTGSDISQAALKLVAIIMRDKRDLMIKDSVIDAILKRIKDDLTEPEYRHFSFNFLRCVLDRKIETAMVYDTLDNVGHIMITNDDSGTRNLARGAFFQFLKEYPQMRARWEKQLNFIVANLNYDREGGRLSVMEVIHLLLQKSAKEYVQEVLATCFVPLVLIIVNDESEKCRLAASELIKQIFDRADSEHLQNFVMLLRKWVKEREKPAVLNLGLKAFKCYFESREPSVKDEKDAEMCLHIIWQQLKEIDTNSVVETSCTDTSSSALIALSSFQLAFALSSRHAKVFFSATTKEHLMFVSSWLDCGNRNVRVACIEVISNVLAHFAPMMQARMIKAKSVGLPIMGSYSLQLDTEMVSDLVLRCCHVLSASEPVDESLATEISQVLLFLSKFFQFGANYQHKDPSTDENDDADYEEESSSSGDGVNGVAVIQQLCRVIRREVPPETIYLVPKLVALGLLSHICRTLILKDDLLPLVKMILHPLNNFVDNAIATPFSSEVQFAGKYEELRNKAEGLMRDLQEKLGTEDFTRNLIAVRTQIREKRQSRQLKRRVEDLHDPEKYGKVKKKRYDNKKDRRKRVTMKHKARRGE